MESHSHDGSNGEASAETESSLETRFSKALKLEDISGNQHVPELKLSQEELDALYARDMYKLSMTERDAVLHDIHGIADIVVETPEFVQEKRRLLKKALGDLTRKKTCFAYQQVQRDDPSYVSSESFELMFLRAFRWDAKQSANKLANFLDAKLDLFGPTVITREIRIKDLSKEDKKSLESGFFQLLPVRDVAGRAIISGMPMLRKYKDLKNLVRSFMYIVMVALQDQETQQNGLVMVGFNTGKDRVVDRPAAWAIQKIMKVLPMRMVGIHFCYDDFKIRPMMSLAMLVMGAHRRVRFRAHYGNCEQHQYKLLTFGMPQAALPITEDGEPKTKAHRQWLKSRQQQEENQTLRNIVVIPRRLDVLFGRGKPIQEHFGNLRYHALLDHYQPAYEQAKKFDKMEIAKRTVDQVHEYSGRFLKQEGAGWIVVDDNIAREKVSHAFRTRRSTILANVA